MQGRLLITGSSGFIGRHMVRKAIESGYNVVGLDLEDPVVEGAKHIEGDIRDPETVKNAMTGVDYVMHLAAITSPVAFIEDPARCYSTNVNGFINVIDAAQKHGVKRFFYASSASMYLDDFSENAIIDIKKQRNHYAKSKMINEMIAHSYLDIYKMDIVGVRYFNVFGLGDDEKGPHASVVGQFLRQREEGKPLLVYGDGKQSRDYIYIDDAVNISLMLLEKGTYPVYNIGTGKAISFNEIADLIQKDGKKFVPNPLSTYQYHTQADTRRLFETIGEYKFTDTTAAIKYLSEKFSSKK